MPYHLLDTQEKNNFDMTIKNYEQPKGISPRFFDETLNSETYEVQGSMGKGLGLSSDSTGVHMAFTAGTGVLVLIDLVARIFLQNIGALP